MRSVVRRPAVAGSWYPGTAAAIAREVDGYLEAAGGVSAPGRLVALVSPHAGLRYSGPVAAFGYGLLRSVPAEVPVVLVGPSHRAAFDGVAVHARGAWETPLGRVSIDEEIAGALVDADPVVFDDPEVHRDEHSLEMQMPFLQRLRPRLRIVPVLMGSQARGEVEALASALARTLAGRPALLVASSDLSHYQPADVANRADARVVDEIERLDADGLMDRLERHHNVACGGGPVVAVMKASRALGADRASVLRYGDSGDVGEHDKSHVVGYLSAALTSAS
ncbi:MAG TPA: AmmeMemoRadiSam system protein B [Vicinamibacteria bacterium]